MGQSSITLFDGTVFDFEERFPSKYKKVGVSLSSGVESAILLPLLVHVYGVENVYAFTGYIAGRRNWESKVAVKIAQMCNVSNIHVIQDDFLYMDPPEQKRMRDHALRTTPIEAWFNGAHKVRFSPTHYLTDPTLLDKYKSLNVELPFVGLLKSHTVDLHYKFNNTDKLYQSHSCTERGDMHCGKCYCCWERVRGFADGGHKDEARYGVSWEEMLQECFYTDKHFNKNW